MAGAPSWAQAPSTVAAAKPGDVRMLVSNGLRVPFQAVKAQAEAAIGHPIVAEYGASRGLTAQMDSGQAFEVAILTGETIDEQITKGNLKPGSRADLAHVAVAVAQRGGKPGKVGTPEDFKALLLGAKLIRYAAIGASRPTVDNAFAKLGVLGAIKPHIDESSTSQTIAAPAMGPDAYELLINLASEFLPVDGWTYLGPIAPQLQVPVVMSAAIGAKGDAKAARAVIDFLKGPAIEGPLTASRMGR